MKNRTQIAIALSMLFAGSVSAYGWRVKHPAVVTVPAPAIGQEMDASETVLYEEQYGVQGQRFSVSQADGQIVFELAPHTIDFDDGDVLPPPLDLVYAEFTHSVLGVSTKYLLNPSDDGLFQLALPESDFAHPLSQSFILQAWTVADDGDLVLSLDQSLNGFSLY